MHYTHTSSTAIAMVDNREGKMCTLILEPPSTIEWNVDYPRGTCYLDRVQSHGKLCGTKLHRWTLMDVLP